MIRLTYYRIFQSKRQRCEYSEEQLKIKDDWQNRWQTLSHGERKRIQLAAALWVRPDLLAIDEPTNHLDSYARN